MKKKLIQQLLFLVYNGYVFPVFNQMIVWSSMVDYSLIRHFIVEFIDNTSAPYDKCIYETVVELISQPASKDSLAENSLKIVKFLSKNNYLFNFQFN